MTVLVTGASGFTGGRLARFLLAAGERVRVLIRAAGKLDADLSEAAEVHIGDLKDAEACRGAARGCRVVYHIAALYRQEGVPRSEFFDVNVGGTRNLLEAALAGGAERFVHCSTVGVHGHVRRPPADEGAPFAPGDPYQRSKLEGEKLALRFGAERGLPVCAFRPTGIYGPGDRRLLKFFRMAKKCAPMIGSGKPHYHLTHIDDLVTGIVLCGTHPAAAGEVFILGGPEAPTLDEWYDIVSDILGVRRRRLHLPVWPFLTAGALCELLFKPLGKEPPLHRRSVHFFTHDRWFSIEKARRVLGFEPKVGVARGMAATAEWYEQNSLL